MYVYDHDCKTYIKLRVEVIIGSSSSQTSRIRGTL